MKNTQVLAQSVAMAFMILVLSIGGDVYAATPVLRIAVAPFAQEQGVGGQSGLSVAEALATRLSARGLERVIRPGDFVARAVFEPRASDIRDWAYASAVDTIVVGRVSKKKGAGRPGPRVVETVLRSGHSGAELSRHAVVVPPGGDLDRFVEKLATAILEKLGHVEATVEEGALAIRAPAVSANAGAERLSDGQAESSSRGLALGLSESEFRSDAPIEIKADEAEIINHDEGRRLIFRRNVWVRQDNVTLRSNWLEASYQKGDSEPRELLAKGKVRVVQNDRRAKCDRAVYLREMNRLTCSGRAELEQGCDIIRGELIEFDLAGNRARVEGAASIVVRPDSDAASLCAKNRGSK